MIVIQGLKELLETFRNGKRIPDCYKLFRSIKSRIEEMSTDICDISKDRETLLQDLENLAYKRVCKRYAWFKDSYIWKRPHVTRYTNIRYDFGEGVDAIARSDRKLKDFMINSALLEIISEYEHCEKDADGQRTKFWESIKEEVNDNCKKIVKSK